MSSSEKEILVRDSRSENMERRLVLLPQGILRLRRRRLLLATSGCLHPAEPVAVEPARGVVNWARTSPCC